LLDSFRNRFTYSSIPTALHCFPEQFGILVGRKGSEFLRCLRVPDYAVTYVLNQKAIQDLSFAREYRVPEIADWPKYMRKIRWLAPQDSMVAHSATGSFVKEARSQRQRNKKDVSLYMKLNSALQLSIFYFTGMFARKYGNSDIASENLRSYVIGGLNVFKK
jgi:hypothetical protein